MSTRPGPPRRDQRGAALMLVLWVLLVLGAASLSILAEVRARVDVAALARSQTVARYAAESGVVAAQGLFEGLIGGAASPAARATAFPEFQQTIDSWGPREIGSGRYQLAVEDLNGRVDINRSRPVVLQGLLQQFVPRSAAEELVSSLRGEVMDGPDAGVDPTQGAVNETGNEPSLRQEPPRFRALTHLEQLARIPGFGDSLAAEVAPFVTFWSDGLINVNTAPLPVLAAVPDIGGLAAGSLMAARDRFGVLASKVAVYSTLSESAPGAASSRLPDVTTVPTRVLVVSRGWAEGHPYTHEVQAVFDVLTSGLVTGPRMRLVSWSERAR